MIRLIKSELGKILRNLLNIFLLIALLLYYGWAIYPELGFQPVSAVTLEGEPLSTEAEFIRYADQVLSKYEGRAEEAMWKRYVNDYNELYAQFTTNIDETRMKELYGSDWKALLQRNESGTLTAQDIDRLDALYADELQRYLSYGFGAYDETANQMQLYIPYKQEKELITLNMIYHQNEYPGYGSGPFSEDKITDLKSYPLYLLSHPEALKQAAMIQSGQEAEELPLVYGDFYTKTNAGSITVGSTITASKLLRCMEISTTYLTTLVLAIVCANIFSKEQVNATDQIIIPTKTNALRLALAKFLAGLILCVGMTLLIDLIAVTAASIIYPPHGLDLHIGWSFVYHSDLSLHLTYWQAILNVIELQLTAAVAVAAFSALFSYFTRSPFAAVILSFALIIGPILARAHLPEWLYWFCPATLSQYDNFHRYTFATGDPVLTNGVWIKDAACLLWIGIAALSLALILFHARRHRAYAK